MKIPFAHFLPVVALLATACNKKEEPPLPASSTPIPATSAPAAPPGPAAVVNPPARAFESLRTPTPEQQRALATALDDMTAQVAKAQAANANIYAKELAAWKAKQAEDDAAYANQQAAVKAKEAEQDAEWDAEHKKLQEQLANPHLSMAERNQLMAKNTPPPPLAQLLSPPPKLPPPTPFAGETKANIAFDSLIYASRQAKEAHDYAKVAALAEQMKALCTQVSPDLVNTYLQGAGR